MQPYRSDSEPDPTPHNLPGALTHGMPTPVTQLYSSPTGWIERAVQQLSVRQKIGLGYGIALGIAVFGTVAGLATGNYLQRQVRQEMWMAHEQGHLVRELQSAVLQARTHQQQLIPLLRDPVRFQEEYQHFQGHMDTVREDLQELQAIAAGSDITDLHDFLESYDRIPGRYQQEITQLVDAIDLTALTPEQAQLAQEALLSFTDSDTALQFDWLSDNLSRFADLAGVEEEAALNALTRVDHLQMQIVLWSMVLSVAIAIFLVIYTSRAISRPLEILNRTAQRVTRESNFDLRAHVATEDEIGTLAESFNQLIERVNQLLAEQQVAMLRERQLQESQLIQSEKMSSLGRMMAGVAHEINNPVNFIYGNLLHAEEYIDDLLHLLQVYETSIPEPPVPVTDYAAEIDFDFTKEDLPKMLQSMKVGADRVRQIVLSLKNFSRLDDGEMQEVDLHACLDNTLLILNNRIKRGIVIERDYGTIPKIEGLSGSLYQVFMNLLSNAVDALEENWEQGQREPTISIATEAVGPWVGVRISDNGPGIPPETQAKIFDIFFTTKPQGVGTGMGLAISREIIEQKHGGHILCTSELGVGTTFVVKLPTHQSSSPAAQFESAATITNAL